MSSSEAAGRSLKRKGPPIATVDNLAGLSPTARKTKTVMAARAEKQRTRMAPANRVWMRKRVWLVRVAMNASLRHRRGDAPDLERHMDRAGHPAGRASLLWRLCPGARAW